MNFICKYKQCLIKLFFFTFVLMSGIGIGFVASTQKHAAQGKPLTLAQKQINQTSKENQTSKANQTSKENLSTKDQKQDLAALQNQALLAQNKSSNKKSNLSVQESKEIAKQRKLARLQERRAKRAAQRANELAYQNRVMQEIVRDQDYALRARDFDEYSRMHRAMHRMRHQDEFYRYQRRATQHRQRQQQIDRDAALAARLQLLELAAAGLI